MNEHYVYALIDPVNRIPFYIGKGKGYRCKAHFEPNHNCNKHKIDYIKNIKTLGFEPLIYKICENISNEDSLQIEKYFINLYKKCLTNKTNNIPDRTGTKLSEEHKKKLRDFNLGKKLSNEHKLKLRESNVHKPVYNMSKPYIDTSDRHNVGSRNPRAKKILVKNVIFGCFKDASNYFNISVGTFKKRYNYEVLN